jgi:hypothetical protein
MRFAGASVSALSATASVVPTDYRSLLPNTSQAHRRDSQGGGVSSGGRLMDVPAHAKSDALALAVCLTAILILVADKLF